MPNMVPLKRTIPVSDWHSKAITITCSLLYFLNNKVFIWLEVISPIATIANIHPYCCPVTLNISIKTEGEPEMYAYKPAEATEPVNA